MGEIEDQALTIQRSSHHSKKIPQVMRNMKNSILEENELDTYMSREVPTEDEAQILTQEELGQGQEDHC